MHGHNSRLTDTKEPQPTEKGPGGGLVKSRLGKLKVAQRQELTLYRTGRVVRTVPSISNSAVHHANWRIARRKQARRCWPLASPAGLATLTLSWQAKTSHPHSLQWTAWRPRCGTSLPPQCTKEGGEAPSDGAPRTIAIASYPLTPLLFSCAVGPPLTPGARSPPLQTSW